MRYSVRVLKTRLHDWPDKWEHMLCTWLLLSGQPFLPSSVCHCADPLLDRFLLPTSRMLQRAAWNWPSAAWSPTVELLIEDGGWPCEPVTPTRNTASVLQTVHALSRGSPEGHVSLALPCCPCGVSPSLALPSQGPTFKSRQWLILFRINFLFPRNRGTFLLPCLRYLQSQYLLYFGYPNDL